MAGHELLLNIAGGVALLLWATRMVRTGITRAYGGDLRRVLAQSTRNKLTAFAMGIGMAGLLQSSTATAILVVSFASRGLVAIAPGLAVMLGADLGSTLVVQVLSFDISWLSPLLILGGVISFLTGASPKWRHLGRVAIGLGLMLLSLRLVVGASEPLRDSAALQSVLAPLSSDPILALLLAALITWLAHSSVAIVLLVMSLTVVGVIPLALGFALVLGANVGSGIIPLMLTLSGNPVGRRIPLGNLLFRALGAIILLPFIGLLAPYVEILGGDFGRQIANFHTLLNLVLAAVFLPLTSAMARLTEKILADTGEGEGAIKPKYLDPTAIDTPPIAISCATREVLRMADIVETMLRSVIDVFKSNDIKLLERIRDLDDEVDTLHESIKLYLTKVSRNALDEEESRRCIEIISFTTNLEHIGDIIDKNLLELAQKKINNRQVFSSQGWQELKELHARVLHQMQLSMSLFVSGDIEIARQLITEKEHFRDLERTAGEHHLARMRSGQVESIQTSALHLDILRDLKRVNSHMTSVAYPILDASGELRHSRLKDRPKSGTNGDKTITAKTDKAAASH